MSESSGDSEVVAEVGIECEAGWLYFLDVNGNVARRPLARKGKLTEEESEARTELIAETRIQREEGYLYFVDSNGNVSRTPLDKRRHSSATKKPAAGKPPAPESAGPPPTAARPAPTAARNEGNVVEPAPGEYRCLSVRQPWADLIVRGIKKVEFRSWSTPYRGTILVHASGNFTPWDELALYYGPDHEFEQGGFVGLVDVVDVVEDPKEEGLYRWLLENPRRIPFRKEKGKLNLYTVAWPPKGKVEKPLRTDWATPETRVPASEALVALLTDEEAATAAEALGVEASGPPQVREALRAGWRFKFWELLDALPEETFLELVTRAGGKRQRGEQKNVNTLLSRLRFVQSEDARDELSEETDEPVPVPGRKVAIEPGWDYAIDEEGTLLRSPEEDEEGEDWKIVQEAFVQPEHGWVFDVAEDGQVVRARLLTWGEAAARDVDPLG